LTPVYRVVRRIPSGRVSTYGRVAALAGMPGAARQVGYALHALTAQDDVPWHRVINARGEISRRAEREVEDLQRALLSAEGIEFDERERVDLEVYGWRPRGQRAPTGGSRGKTAPGKRAGRTPSGVG
jgi:methylated-DNA-protein-cysteine methyltransferase-like protein